MMENILILAEKPDARKNFAKALGGESGVFEGRKYQLVNSRGHIFEYKNPEEMVSPEKAARYADWDHLSSFPWDENDFNWSKRLKSGMGSVFSNIKKASQNKDAIVIATDDDESGEGDLIGWEIVNALSWKKKVYRCRFSEETPEYLKKGLHEMKNVTDQWQQGKFLKSNGRAQFDDLSKQLSRIALKVSRSSGYTPNTIRIGRLKSPILQVVYDMTEKRDNYVKKPFYEVRFVDNNKNIFKNDNEEDRLPTAAQAEKAKKKFTSSAITIDSRENKRIEPPSLIDLSTISVLLGKRGYSDKAILNTYQKMYQNEHWLSYPRPGENKITQGLFDKLMPLVDRIADVIEADRTLLTHRTARKKYLAKKVNHGANRPGLVVPASLNAIKVKYGQLGVDLYTVVAKAFLATLCEDYLYIKEIAHLNDYPDFKSTRNSPVIGKRSFRDLVNPKKTIEEAKPFGNSASPFVYQGVNTKPPEPTKKAVVTFLKKNGIGTNATIPSTLSALVDDDIPLLKLKKNVYSFTYEGRVQALLCQNSVISSPNTTKKLKKAMDLVEQRKMNYKKIPASMRSIVKKDMPTMQANIKLLTNDKYLTQLAKNHKSFEKYEPKGKVEGVWKGKKVSINKTWGTHAFTNQEISDLFAGKEIQFDAISKRGDPYVAKGKLAKQSKNKHTYYGFKLNRK